MDLTESADGSSEARLARATEEFLRWGLVRHLAALAALALVVLALWREELTQPIPALDEQVYLRAFAHTAEGRSPYIEKIFLYPPAIAHAGAWVWQRLGQDGTAYLLRGLNGVGLLALLWLSVACWPLPMRWRLALAALVAAASPGIAYGLAWGNLSLAALGLFAFGLLAWPRQPWLAGITFAASTLLKPLAPAGLLALAAARPLGRRIAVSAWITAGLAGLLALAATLASPWAGELLGLSSFHEHTSRTVSSRRLLASLGLGEIDALVVALGVGLAVVLWLRLRPRGVVEISLAATVAVVLVTPILWIHTFLVTLPLQGAALAHAFRRRQSSDPTDGLLRRHLEPTLVLVAILSQHATNGVDGATRLPWLLPLALAVPLLAPLALHVYVFRENE